MGGTMNEEPTTLQYKPEVTDKLIDAIPENVYDLCFCGCGKKWKFVKQSPDVEEHFKRFCEKVSQ
jgi:hypothetical protein